MKISRLFHWLYLAVMLLPIVVIPVFAIAVRSDNNYQPITIDTSGYEVTEKYQTNELHSNNDFVEGNVYYYETYFHTENIVYYGDPISFHILNGYVEFSNGEMLFEIFTSMDDSTEVVFTIDSSHDFYVKLPLIDGSYQVDYFYFEECDLYFTGNDIIDFIDNNRSSFDYHLFYPSTLQAYDIQYNEGIVLDDTDLGSQVVYTLYEVTDKYFNYDTVLNFQDIYNWANATLFNGNAPLGFTIFWHLLTYWLLTSILWLIFDVIIYVPLLAHRWLDKASLS